MKTIIHVDNSEFFRKLVKTFLGEHGFEVESFDNAEEALGQVSAGQVGLIITGLSFSDMDGNEFIKRIIGYPYIIPIIALTSSQSPQIEYEARRLGVKGWIHKSSAWQEQLLPLVRQYLGPDPAV
ncbi:MAG: response regulator [Spirochaetaceae bacterium]|jgi:two-component system cell cycle response regulator|nr:response regulator [Spirochaetaceae bacterium]